jgi:hypothetical protein
MFKYSPAEGPSPEVLEVDSSDVLDLLSS